MSSLLSTLRGRSGYRSDIGALSLDEWASYFNFNGLSYGISDYGGTLGGNREEIANNFIGVAQGAYRSNGVIFACMLVRQMLFSEARLQYRRLRNGRPGDLFGTADLQILEHPWVNGTTGDLLSRMIQDADLSGNFFATIRGTGADRHIRRLRPDWVTIITGSQSDPNVTTSDLDAVLVGYLYHPNGAGANEKPTVLLPDEVCHFAPVPDPLASYRGMSWLTPIIRETMSDAAMTQHKLSYFENGATPNMVVTLDPSIKREAFDQWIELFEDRHVGPLNAYKTLYLGGGSDTKLIGNDLKQVDFKAVQGATETRIAAAAGVPPVIVGLSEGLAAATYANYGQARRRLTDGPQPLDAKVLTPSGWSTMGDMEIGAQVIGSDGKPHAVVGVYDQGEQDVYRVDFLDGGSTECSPGHLWNVSTESQRRRGTSQTLPLSEMLAQGLHAEGKAPKFAVPLTDPVEFAAEAPLPLEPYLLGLLLGDGTFRARGSVALASGHHDADEVQTRIAPMLPAGVEITRFDSSTVVNLTLKGVTERTHCRRGHEYTPENTYQASGYRQCRTCARGSRRRRDGTNRSTCGYGDGATPPVPKAFTIMGQLVEGLGLLGAYGRDKFVPQSYLRATVPDRIALLQGLVDSDGCVTNEGGVQFATDSPSLVRDVVELVRSLGGIGTVRRVANRTSVTVGILRLPSWIIPARLSRKAERYRPVRERSRFRSIAAATLVRRAPTRCIALDSPDNLYLTDDFVVTHNTMRPLWRNAAASLATLVTRFPDAELWYDARDIAFLHEDQKDDAAIKQAQAQTIRSLIDAGYKPDSVVAAVSSGDFGLLVHTGLYSVQLQPPGTTFAPAGSPNDVASGSRDGNGTAPAGALIGR